MNNRSQDNDKRQNFFYYPIKKCIFTYAVRIAADFNENDLFYDKHEMIVMI